jgi:hypothetical protein
LKFMLLISIPKKETLSAGGVEVGGGVGVSCAGFVGWEEAFIGEATAAWVSTETPLVGGRPGKLHPKRPPARKKSKASVLGVGREKQPCFMVPIPGSEA